RSPPRLGCRSRPSHIDHIAHVVLASSRRFQQRRQNRLLAHGAQRQHGVALLECGNQLLGPQRWHTGWNEVNLLEVKTLLRRLRQGKMTFMNGIEGTAEQGDIHAPRSVSPK